MKHLALPAFLSLALASCGGAPAGGGGGDGSLGSSLNSATAPYAIVDLATRSITYRASIPDLATAAVYRTGKIVFKRVISGGRDVLVAVFELTQGQWSAIDGTTPWAPLTNMVMRTPAPDLPACNLDYDLTVAALAAFPLASGAHLALPTDAEWSSACGATSGWSWGQTASLVQLQAATVVYESSDGTIGAAAVGGRSPNSGGYYDMHGNIWELTSPAGHVRGGSWHDSYWLSRSEFSPGSNQGLDSSIPHALIGARLVLRP